MDALLPFRRFILLLLAARLDVAVELCYGILTCLLRRNFDEGCSLAVVVEEQLPFLRRAWNCLADSRKFFCRLNLSTGRFSTLMLFALNLMLGVGWDSSSSAVPTARWSGTSSWIA